MPRQPNTPASSAPAMPDHDDHGAPQELDVPPDLAAMFDAHLGPVADPRRPGEFSVSEFRLARRLSDGQAHVQLQRLIAAGRVARRPGPRNTHWYRFVSVDKKPASSD